MEKTAEKAKVRVEKRDDFVDKMVTKFFDNLWVNPTYLDLMSKNLDVTFELRKNWNKNMETVLSLFELPNQKMQQKTLHNLNTLLTEWRFEQEELKLRLDKIEKDIEALAKAPAVSTAQVSTEEKNAKAKK